MKVSLSEIYESGTSCPTCQRDDFESEFAVKMHHTTTHDQSLPNSRCDDCGGLFHNSKPRKYCDECLDFSGENNPNYKGMKEESSCEECGSKFEYYPSNKEGVYCSECATDGGVYWGACKTKRFASDEKNPNWSGGDEIIPCDWCGSETLKDPRYEHSFCNTECMGKWKSENIRGEDHHNWEGGDIPYGETWWRERKRQLNRDSHKCQYCGKSKEELGKEPDVHHKTPVREFNDPNDAHFKENLVTLCRKHHRTAETGEIDVSNL